VSDNPQQRRNAVHQALQPFLPPSSLQKAVEYWERHFDQSGSGTIHRFVTDVCQSNGLANQRSEMLMAVVAAVNPERTSAANAPMSEAGKAPADDAQVRAFEALVAQLLAQLDALTGEQLRADLIASLRPDRFPGPFISRLRGWLLHRRTLRPVEVSTSGLRATINQLYVLMAERLGPVETDRILHEANRRTRDDTPELADPLARIL
jgi:hypothetical protein